MRLIEINDYVFYRSYMFYQDGRSYSAGLVAVIQFFTGLSILTFLNMGLIVDFNKYIIMSAGFILLGINAFRYEGNFDIKELHNKWGDESLFKKRLKGWGIVLYTILVVAIPVTFGYLKHN